MSIESIQWALSQRVGSGQLKATLVAIACLSGDGPVQKSAVARETGLTSETLRKHFGRLKALGFIAMTAREVSLKAVQQ